MAVQSSVLEADSNSRRLIIGDVHGHYAGVMNLLDLMAPSQTDQVYFLGDLIDRGPDSAKVIELLRRSGYTTLLGNHEQMLIDAFPDDKPSMPDLQAWLYSGGQTTFSSYNFNPEQLMADLRWLRQQHYQLDLGDAWLVHAGLNPDLKLEDQSIEDVCWIRDLFHQSSTPYFSDKLIITGHTITFTFPQVEPGQLVQGQGWLDIDTGAYHRRSGWLTGIDIDNWVVHQVNVHQAEARQLSFDEAVVSVTPEQLERRHHGAMKVA